MRTKAPTCIKHPRSRSILLPAWRTFICFASAVYRVCVIGDGVGECEMWRYGDSCMSSRTRPSRVSVLSLCVLCLYGRGGSHRTSVRQCGRWRDGRCDCSGGGSSLISCGALCETYDISMIKRKHRPRYFLSTGPRATVRTDRSRFGLRFIRYAPPTAHGARARPAARRRPRVPGASGIRIRPYFEYDVRSLICDRIRN